jgi:hypothetical protein
MSLGRHRRISDVQAARPFRRKIMATPGIEGVGSVDGVGSKQAVLDMMMKTLFGNGNAEAVKTDPMTGMQDEFDSNTSKAAGEADGANSANGAQAADAAKAQDGEQGVAGLLKKLMKLLEKLLPLLKQLAQQQGNAGGANPAAANAANGLGNPAGSPLGTPGASNTNAPSSLDQLGNQFIDAGNTLDAQNAAIKAANPQAFPQTETNTDTGSGSNSFNQSNGGFGNPAFGAGV